MPADRRLRDNETGINRVMLDGSEEVDDFRRIQISDVKSIPQRGTMPGGTETRTGRLPSRSAALSSSE